MKRPNSTRSWTPCTRFRTARLTSAEQARMNLQAHYMARYSEILGERIAAFQRDAETAARSVA